MKATIITKPCSGLITETERLSIMWPENQNQHQMPISLTLLQEKAQSPFNGLKVAGTANKGDF